MRTRELLLATRSAGKLRELTPLMREFGFRVVSLDDVGIAPQAAEDDLEAFDTFEANAQAKARWFLNLSEGRPVLADDSGLVVDALGGRPGVHSKRWSGYAGVDGPALDQVNNAFLIDALRQSNVPQPHTARYVCAAACAWHGGELVVRGETEGHITSEPLGDQGFGYDSHFYSFDLGRTFGQASREGKAQVSHRGRAFRTLVSQLGTIGYFDAAAVDH